MRMLYEVDDDDVEVRRACHKALETLNYDAVLLCCSFVYYYCFCCYCVRILWVALLFSFFSFYCCS